MRQKSLYISMPSKILASIKENAFYSFFHIIYPLRGERPRNAGAFQGGANTLAKVEHFSRSEKAEKLKKWLKGEAQFS